jgi:flagellar biosynthesis chaperone FliJ
MPDRAQVTSLEAIEAFRARLITYREKAGRVLDEVSDEVTRARLRLQTDYRMNCEGQIRRCHKEVEMRQQELFSAQLSGLREASYAQQHAVNRAKQKLREAEEKLQKIKIWHRQFDQRVEPPTRQVDKLRHTLVNDLAQGIAHLAAITKTLDDYAGLTPSSPAAKPTEPNPDAS